VLADEAGLGGQQLSPRAPGVVEIRISFDKIGLDPAGAAEIGIAFNVTDTREVWAFWPPTATLEDPGSWATARMVGEAR